MTKFFSRLSGICGGLAPISLKYIEYEGGGGKFESSVSCGPTDTELSQVVLPETTPASISGLAIADAPASDVPGTYVPPFEITGGIPEP